MHTKPKRIPDRKYTRKNRRRRPLGRSAACLILALAIILAAAGCMKREKVEGVWSGSPYRWGNSSREGEIPAGNETGETEGQTDDPAESGTDPNSTPTTSKPPVSSEGETASDRYNGEVPSVQVVGTDFFGCDREYRMAKTPLQHDTLSDVTAYYVVSNSNLTLSGQFASRTRGGMYETKPIAFTGRVYNAEDQGYPCFADLTVANSDLIVLYATIVRAGADDSYGRIASGQPYVDLLVERKDDGSLLNCQIPLKTSFMKVIEEGCRDKKMTDSLFQMKMNLSASQHYSLQDGVLTVKKEPLYNDTLAEGGATVESLVSYLEGHNTIISIGSTYMICDYSYVPESSVSIYIEVVSGKERQMMRVTEDYNSRRLALQRVDPYSYAELDSPHNQTFSLDKDAYFGYTMSCLGFLY